MKKYVLIVSEKFPKTHQRSGENTNFIAQIKNALKKHLTQEKVGIKRHTMRGNYELWKKRIDEIQAGKAYLSVRIWTGKPYNSKQKEILQLTEVGIQKLESWHFFYAIDNIESKITTEDLSVNDGLSCDDFQDWFKKAKYPMAIIHFTDFRY